MGKINILHLSDIHIGHNYTDPNDLVVKIVDEIKKIQEIVSCIVVTGDIFNKTYGSNEDERQVAIEFFTKLLNGINNYQKERKILQKHDILFVPGNHDLDRGNIDKDVFNKYKLFLSSFTDDWESMYQKNFTWYKIFDKEKVVILGLNSCNVNKKLNLAIEKKLEDFFKQNNDVFKNANLIKTRINNYISNNYSFDDYGKIPLEQISFILDEVKSKVNNINDYKLVAAFHHHFYPFPQYIQNNDGDSDGIIRNFAEIIQKFYDENISVVLHGHKHFGEIKPIIDYNFYNDPTKMIHVFAAGSTNNKDCSTRKFNLIEIYDKKEFNQIGAYTITYDNLKVIQEPRFLFPNSTIEGNNGIKLESIYQGKICELLTEYDEIIDSIVSDFNKSKINDILAKVFTTFDKSKQYLLDRPSYALAIKILINYRTIFLHNQFGKNIKNNVLKLDKFFSLLQKIFPADILDVTKELLSSANKKDFEKAINKISNSNFNNENKKILSLVIFTVFFSDLYLSIYSFNKEYFINNNIETKTNLGLPKESFEDHIEKDSIQFLFNEDKREIIIEFLCDNPSIHEAQVLIIKDFEALLPAMDEYMNLLGIKYFHILVSIEKRGYDFENYNFEGYIPNLIPLLAGENIYNDSNAFIRELVQNAIDAIILRRKIASDIDINDEIIINTGEENGKKYFEIIDTGIGMDEFKIERYFTSLGKSYYKSDEFKDLLRSKKTDEYIPISKFGIGFLSVFMVSNDVHVITKQYDSNYGLRIKIPNFDGCFFVNKIESKNNCGTSIRLYEDDRARLNFSGIRKYIFAVLKNINLPIIFNKEKIEAYSLWEKLKKKHETNLMLYLPFDSMNIDKSKYGAFIDFSLTKDEGIEYNNRNINCYVEGIHVNERLSKLNYKYFNEITFNFQAEHVDLDVSREKIKRLGFNLDKLDIVALIEAQISNSKLEKCENHELMLLYSFLLTGDFKNLEENSVFHFLNKIYNPKIDLMADKIIIDFSQANEVNYYKGNFERRMMDDIINSNRSNFSNSGLIFQQSNFIEYILEYLNRFYRRNFYVFKKLKIDNTINIETDLKTLSTESEKFLSLLKQAFEKLDFSLLKPSDSRFNIGVLNHLILFFDAFELSKLKKIIIHYSINKKNSKVHQL